MDISPSMELGSGQFRSGQGSYLCFPGGSDGKESAYNAGDLGLIPGLGRFPGEGKSYPLQYSGLENSIHCMVCIVHGIAKSQTQLSNFHLYLLVYLGDDLRKH